MPAQDACDLLDADHRNVEMLFSQYQGADDSAKPDLAQKICMELVVHATIEEEIFYPAFREATKEDRIVDEAQEDHGEAKDLITEIEDAEATDALMLQLQTAVEQHVNEERTVMFPKARQAKGLDLVQLGQQLQARKTELMANVQ